MWDLWPQKGSGPWGKNKQQNSLSLNTSPTGPVKGRLSWGLHRLNLFPVSPTSSSGSKFQTLAPPAEILSATISSRDPEWRAPSQPHAPHVPRGPPSSKPFHSGATWPFGHPSHSLPLLVLCPEPLYQWSELYMTCLLFTSFIHSICCWLTHLIIIVYLLPRSAGRWPRSWGCVRNGVQSLTLPRLR